MARLRWNEMLTGRYQAGVDRGVFYNVNGEGVVWDGLVSVLEGSDDVTSYIHLDGAKLMNRKRFGTFQATIGAYTYPSELDARRSPIFGMSYRVITDGKYQIHLIYNATAIVQGPIFSSINGESQAMLFTINLSTMNMTFAEDYRTSHLVIETDNEALIVEIEDVLYGSPAQLPHLPTPEELIEIFESHALIRVTDNQDGTFTISGPDELVHWTDSTTFEVISDGITWLDSETYRIRST